MVFQFYSRAVLLSIISSIHHIPVLDKATWRVLKNNGIARTITRRGCRAGSAKQRPISTVTGNGKNTVQISAVKTTYFRRNMTLKVHSIVVLLHLGICKIQQIQQIVPSWEIRLSGQHARNVFNLIYIQPERQQPSSCSSDRFAVPKFLLTNICSLVKTKNRVRAVVALEADLNNNDIDACIVSETHLKPDIPDSMVNIPSYDIYRR